MKDNSQRLYTEILYGIIINLKDKIKFNVCKIDYNNVELLIEKSNIEDINSNDFSISFQKQNGSFTLVTNMNIGIGKRQKIIDLLKDVTGTDLFASYNFSDMQNINIDHFVYDETKLDFNRDILNEFRSKNEIINVIIKKEEEHKKR